VCENFLAEILDIVSRHSHGIRLVGSFSPSRCLSLSRAGKPPAVELREMRIALAELRIRLAELDQQLAADHGKIVDPNPIATRRIN
jgi:hypothetical protein